MPLTPKEANARFSDLNRKLGEQTAFSVNVIHRTFQNYQTTQWAFQYDGYIHKLGKSYHSLLMGIHTIQNEKYRIVLDTTKHIMLVSSPSEEIDLGNYAAQNEKMLQACKEIKTKTDTDKTLFHFTFGSKSPYSKSELAFNKEHMPLYIKIFLNKEVKVKKDGVEKLEKPRIEVNYTNYTKNQKIGAAYFSEKKYFTESSSGLQLTEAFKDYTIKDLRVKTSK